MNKFYPVVIFYFLLNLININGCDDIPPNLLFEIFEPKGLRISIRDVKNSTEFKVFGNVNKKLTNNQETEFNQRSEKPCKGRWTLYFPDVIVQVNDKIYIRYYLKIDDTVFVSRFTKKIYSYDIIPTRDSDPNSLQQCCPDDVEEKSNLDILTNKYEKLNKEVQTLKELLFKLTADSTKNNKLMLIGKKPPGVSATKDIRQFIIDKLKLYEFEYNIVQADYTECGISFEMETSVQKALIISRAFELLQTSRFKIEDISECQTENYDQIHLGARNS